MRTRALLATALLLAVTLAGCSGGDGGRAPLPEAWRGRDLRKGGWANQTLEPGWTLGVEYTWSSGTQVSWDWFVHEAIFAHFQLVRMDAPGGPRVVVSCDAQQAPCPPAQSFPESRRIVDAGVHQIDVMNEYYGAVTVAYTVPAGGTMRLYAPGEGPGCLYSPGRSSACLAPDLPLPAPA